MNPNEKLFRSYLSYFAAYCGFKLYRCSISDLKLLYCSWKIRLFPRVIFLKGDNRRKQNPFGSPPSKGPVPLCEQQNVTNSNYSWVSQVYFNNLTIKNKYIYPRSALWNTTSLSAFVFCCMSVLCQFWIYQPRFEFTATTSRARRLDLWPHFWQSHFLRSNLQHMSDPRVCTKLYDTKHSQD